MDITPLVSTPVGDTTEHEHAGAILGIVDESIGRSFDRLVEFVPRDLEAIVGRCLDTLSNDRDSHQKPQVGRREGFFGTIGLQDHRASLAVIFYYLSVSVCVHTVPTTFQDLSEGSGHTITVKLNRVEPAQKAKRAFHLHVEDRVGTEFEIVIWNASAAGSTYDWKAGRWYTLGGLTVRKWSNKTIVHGTDALEIDDVGREEDTTEILYLTDSHLDKTTGGYGGTKWPLRPKAGFEAAVSMACERDVDAVVHGGDIFHNPSDGISNDAHEFVFDQLTTLAEYDIPFNYILGNHERANGRQLLETFVEGGLAGHLGTSPTRVGETCSIYGIDFQQEWHSKRLEGTRGTEASDRTGLVFLHQSVAPFTSDSQADTSLSRLTKQFQEDIALVGIGHTHTKGQQTVFDGSARQQLTGIAGAATTRVGKNRDSFAPTWWTISAPDHQVTVQEHSHPTA